MQTSQNYTVIRLFSTVILVAGLILVFLNAANCEPFCAGQREFTASTGYGENHRIPTCMKDRFQFGDTTLRYGRFVSDRDENAFELGFSNQISGTNNQAVMAVTTKRHYFAVKGNSALGYDMAFGVMRFEHAIEGLATRMNFTEQLGVVLTHKTGANSALSVQYRFFHCSNGGIKKPNVGVNASVLSIGYSWFM